MKGSNIGISNPCTSRWNDLSGSGNSRFCPHCSTEVIDFTTKTDSEIIAYVSRQKTRVCGRVRKDQAYVDHVNSRQTFFKTLLILTFGLTTTPVAVKADKTLTSETAVSPSGIKESFDNLQSNLNFNPIDSAYIFTGKVLSANSKSALPGVSIVIKGTMDGTITDINGQFELKLSDTAFNNDVVLIFSYVGTMTVELELEPKSTDNILIEMEDDLVMMGEMIIPRWWTPRGLWWRIKSIFS